MNYNKINGNYIGAVFIAVACTWLLHEFTHWITSELLGYDTIMRLNSTSTTKGQNPSDVHKVIISISAPVITVLQGSLVFLVLKRNGWNKYLYPLLFSAFYMRFLAGLMNFINVNDEGRVGQFLGIGTFTLSILVSGLLFYLVYEISRKNKLGWKFQLWTTILVMMASSLLILSDQYFGIRLI